VKAVGDGLGGDRARGRQGHERAEKGEELTLIDNSPTIEGEVG
jgi:hypothetical protein